VFREISFPSLKGVIVEGSTVTTKYGPLKTDNILFIAAGAFHTVKPSDLIPELQGRFPIRVGLDSLGRKEFVRILTEPKNALLLQYLALLKTEGNIGARRLHTIMECLLEDILFDAPDMTEKRVVIDKKYVEDKLKDIKEDEDLSRYIL